VASCFPGDSSHAWQPFAGYSGRAMHPHADSPSVESAFIAAIVSDDVEALRHLVARHGTEWALTHQFSGRTTRAEIRGTPLSVAAHLRRDRIASFLVRNGADHGYSIETCATQSFTISRSVVPIDLALAFEMSELTLALMAAGCVDWLEHNYQDDSESGYAESDPLLYSLLASKSRLRFIEGRGVFRGFLGSRFVAVECRDGGIEVTVDGIARGPIASSMSGALRWLWNTVATAEMNRAHRGSAAISRRANRATLPVQLRNSGPGDRAAGDLNSASWSFVQAGTGPAASHWDDDVQPPGKAGLRTQLHRP
jgi:hypothetical protein